MRLFRRSDWFFMCFFGLAIAIFVLMEFGRPELWQIRDGYRGWIVVHYSDPNCFPLSTRGICRVIVIDKTGYACTASPMSYKWTYDKAEYVMPDGNRKSIRTYGQTARLWRIASSSESNKELDFAGSREEMLAHWAEQPQIAPTHVIKQ